MTHATPEALGLVKFLAAAERPTWAAVSDSIPAWHPRNEGNDGDAGDGTDGADGAASADKTVTITQSKLDRLIASRVNQAKSQFADYDDLKAKADKLADLERQNLSDAERLSAERDEARTAAEKAAADLAEANLANTRMRVALETKLPAELMGRLQGDNEDALREDAEKLLALFPSEGDGGKPKRGSDGGYRKSPEDSMTYAEARKLARENPMKFNELLDAGKIPASALRPE